jgi:L,D-peptidoglycan transpeptidase YkuD (ErfK/YbiS/YcfS/YnhG family)
VSYVPRLLLAVLFGSFTLMAPCAASQAEEVTGAAIPTSCVSTLPGVPTEPLDVRQIVLVEAGDKSATVGSVSFYSRTGSCYSRVGGPWSVELGRSGISSHKSEGDGTTPIGVFAVGPVMYGVAPNPGVAYSYHRLVCGDWWDEASSSPRYNRFVHVACGTAPPFGGDSEALWRVVPQYDYLAVIQYNSSPVIPGRGSAIFLHLSSGAPTAGCVALRESRLVTLLRWLRPDDHPVVAIGLVSAHPA